jgi:hypothetical protein
MIVCLPIAKALDTPQDLELRHTQQIKIQSKLLARARSLSLQNIQFLKSKWIDEGGIELITGGPSSAHLQSRWGHVSIRFVGSGDTQIEDITMEALGLNSPDDAFKETIVKGTNGGYPIFIMFTSIGDIVRQYYFNENRGYSRTIIPSNRKLRIAVLQVIEDWLTTQVGTDRYYFFSNNCASFMAALLDRAGFHQLPQPTPLIPTQMSLHLRRSYLAPFPEILGVSADRMLKLRDLNSVRAWSKLATLDLQRLIAFHGLELGSNLPLIAQTLRTRNDKKSADQVYAIEARPAAFYQRESGDSLNLRKLNIKSYFSFDELESATLFNRASWMTTYNSSFCNQSNMIEQCDYFNNIRKAME